MTDQLPSKDLNWMPFDAGVKYLADRLAAVDSAWVLKHWNCKYLDVRVDMRTGAMLIKPGNELFESCQCDGYEWRPDYVEIRDSRGGLHYADKPCRPAQPPGVVDGVAKATMEGAKVWREKLTDAIYDTGDGQQ